MDVSTETSSQRETSNKRKMKNKIPKRLRHKNREANTNDERSSQEKKRSQERSIPRREIQFQETTPFFLSALRMTTEHKPMEPTNDQTVQFWKHCVETSLDLLQKQASKRRQMLIDRHHERVDAIQRLIYQREQIDLLTAQNHSMSELLDSLRHDLQSKEECIEILQVKLHDRDDLIRNNEYLRIQLKSIEHKLERFTVESNKKLEEYRRNEIESTEHIQSLLDEIERIKRDLVLEEYRKQEAERKVRTYEEKMKLEQNFNKKLHHDLHQMKQELRSSHLKYDALQMEMLALHKANNNDISLLPTRDTNQSNWSENPSIDETIDTKRMKRKTRDRSQSSASTSSNISDKRHRTDMKPTKLIEKDSTESTGKKAKKPTPVVTVTRASPMKSVEKESTQLSEENATTAETNEISVESQPVTSKVKKQSRYPCRRAQRPAKATESVEESKQ